MNVLESLTLFFSKVSLLHLNSLLLLGLAIFGGTIGGRLFQKMRIPQVVGYITIGIVLGDSVLKLVNHDTILTLQPFSYFTLGLIGFKIGGELNRKVMARYGKQFLSILLFEGLTTFLLVTCSVGLLGHFFIPDWKLSWALGLLLGAIASATAPAATVEVLREFKTRGPLTRTILGIVALDDGLALVLFAVASSIAGNLMGNAHEGLWRTFINPLYEIGGAILLGILGGLLLIGVIRKCIEEERILVVVIGTVLLITGLAITIHVDMLLSAMVLGVMVCNFAPRKSQDVFKLLDGFAPPIFVLFFVLVGAKLNLRGLSFTVLTLGCVYLISRGGGKALGAYLGARISNAHSSVRRYLPLCLFSQAGVAIGLSILVSQYFPGDIGSIVVAIVTTTVFILEIAGPPLVKLAVGKAGEIGMNITEEDLFKTLKVAEVMDKNPPVIFEYTPFMEILKIFSDNDYLYFPVVDKDGKITGILTVDSIKQTLTRMVLSGLLLAYDIMEPVMAVTDNDAFLHEAKRLMNKHNLEYLLVATRNGKVAGLIESRKLGKLISTRIVEMQKRIE